MAFKHTQGDTKIEVPSDTTLIVNGGIDLTGATVTVPANTINSTGTFDVATLNVTGATEQGGTPIAAGVTFTPATGGTNISDVTIQVVDGAGNPIAAVYQLDVWLSDAATGAGLTGTTASGTVTNKSASGVVISTYTAKKALRVQTLATGVFVLEITDTAKTGFYVAAALLNKAVVSAQLVTGNYG